MPTESLTFLSVFLIGLGLNLTPCVYPILSVTLSLFSSRKEKSSHIESMLRAAAYVAGMIVTNTTLGTLAALTGSLFGGFLQNRWVLGMIGTVLLILALSMFGLYSLQVPSSILNRLSNRKAVSHAGFFLSGLFVGLFAAPCIGPPILALLTVVSAKGDPTYAFLTFFILSLGLGFPYLLLGSFSGLISKLPRSGPWLLWVERFFGVILLGVAAFYFSSAFQSRLTAYLIPGGLIAGGIYLGFLERSVQYPKTFDRLRKTLGVTALGIGLLLLFLGPRTHLQWQVYSAEKLERSKQNQKPVLLDFYADWCIPCHEFEQFTYSHPKVIEALRNFDKYKIDLTDQESEDSEQVIERFEILGVPTVIFLDSEGKEIPEARLTGFVGPKEFLKLLKEKVEA